ncbi:MAG: CDP-diacylglycerol--serine O-phosphatidyltransferase [Muribaculaceae bacterium]|nr:CDP-diacylglycerol--serine O-phosphatidyltransferase [Muribaculaceae bacterium]
MFFRKIVTSVPNTLTLCNLVSGCLACICAFSFEEDVVTLFGKLVNGRQLAWILVGLAAVFDFFDGAAARWLHAPSPLGKELDSLADLVSFGVAPSLLLYNILQVWTGSWWIPFVALFIPAMGALRLAKFNLDDSQATEFKGLPIPANAIFWIGATAWMQSHASEWMHAHVYWGNLIVSATIVLVALLMVSNMRMFSFKLKNFRIGDNLPRYILLVAAVAFVVIFGVEGLAYTIILYFFLSAFALARQGKEA